MFGVGRKIRAWGREFEDQLDKRLGKTGKKLAIAGQEGLEEQADEQK